MKTLFNTTYMRIAKRIVMVVTMALVVGNVWGANWTKVNNLSEISNGDSVLVVIQDGKDLTVGKAMVVGGSGSSNITSVTITSNSYISNPADTIKWAITLSDGLYTFNNGNNYIRASKDDNTTLMAKTTGDYKSWHISKLSDGYFKVQLTNSSGRYISHSTSSDYFAKYVNSSFINQITSKASLGQYYGAVSFYLKGCDKIVALSKGTQTNATISSFSKTSVETCSSTAADRNVTITVAAATGYKFVSGARLTYTGDGTAEYVSGPTGSGPYTWVYRFSQNDNGSGTFSVTSATAKTATLSFNQNGGEGGQSENKTATYGQAMPTPIATPTKFGHIFGGYYDGVGGTGNKYYNADGTSARNWDKNTESTTTLYAKWTEKDLTNYRTMCESVYDIVLDDNNGGSNNGSARVEASRNTLSAIEAPTRTGYEVEGYYTDDACTAANKIATKEGALLPSVSVSETAWTNESSQWVKGGDATFYTKWTAIEYTITYEGLEGASNSNSTSYTVATPTFALANPGSREGYTFTGWTCGGDAITQIALGTTSNKTITANWSLNSHTLAVSAEENVTISATPASASTIAEGSNASVNYGKTVTLNGEPDEHFAMTWKVYKTGDESTPVSVSGEGDGATFTMPDYNVTITVVKTEDPKKTVSFYNNGTLAQSGYVYVGERPSAPTLDEGDACDDERNTHYGWCTSTWTNVIDTKASLDEDYTVYFKDVSLPVVAAENPSEITYHAVWSKQEGELSYEYQLVTDIANLSAGDKVVIANAGSSSTYLLGYQRHTDAGYHFRPQSSNAYTITSSKVTLTSSDVAAIASDETHPYVLTLGKNGDYWTFYDAVNGGYLCATTADKNELNVRADDSDGASRFTISISSNVASITSQVTPESTPHNLLQYLTSTFNCYKSTSGGTNPCIFRSLSTAVFSEFLTTCCSNTIEAPDVEDSKTAYTVTLSWDAVETANGDASSYEMQWNGGDWTTVTSPVVKSELTPNTAYSWKVRIKTWTGEYYCAAEEASGSTTTNPVYTVTYNAGGGTGSMAVVSYEAGDAVTVLTNGFTRSGYNWDSWSYSPAVEVSEGQFSMPEENVTITAQWTAKPLNSISLAESAISVYVGEIKYVDVIYDPSDILTKGFTQVSTPSYCQIGTYASNMQAKITGGRGGVTITENAVETVSIKANADNTKTASIEVTVKPLPKVTFIDIVQDKTDFSGGDTYDAGTGVLKSMVTAGVVDHTLTVPSHADVAAPGTGNTCEQQHLHLMGWIRGDWADPYMAVPDGTLPGKDAILEADDGDGTIYIAVGEEIDLEALNGKTYYAVWAKAE